MKRRIFSPARELLARTDLSPGTVDDAIQAMVLARADALLRKHHPLVAAIERATGINVVRIARKSRYLLLIEIEQHGLTRPAWQYRERSPNHCVFSCEGELPDAIEVALQGELLEKLVIPTAALKDTVICTVGDTGDGWLRVAVQPTWHLF